MRHRRWAILGIAALLASACGSRLPDDVLARIDAGGGQVAAPIGDGSKDGSNDGGSTDVTTGPGGTVGGPGGGGTNTTSGTTPSGQPVADCSGGGATDTGVTATEIKVASIVTASGPLPGATEGGYHGAAAYLAKVNAEGGVCGRKITILEGDDGLDPQRARTEFLRLEPQVLAFVGPFAVADSGYLDQAEKTGVPYIGTFVDPAGRELPNTFPKTQANVTDSGQLVYYKQAHPDVTNAGFLFADVGGVRSNTPGVLAAMRKAGFNIVYNSGVQATSPDYTSEVINLRNRSADLIYLFAFEINMQVRFARNMRQQNWEPKVKVANIAYNSRLIGLLGDIANGWSNPITYQPVLDEAEPAKNQDLATFLEWNRRVFPNGQIDLFPVSGWAAAALFVEALRAVGGNVTRERLLEALNNIHSWDGDGIQAPSDPTNGANEGCFLVERVENGKWIREYPDAGYECDLGETFSY